MRFRIVYIYATIVLSACTYTSGTNVTSDQAKQFTVGQSTAMDVEAKLGQPTSSQTNSDGTKTLLYEYTSTHQDAMNYLPLVGLVHNKVEQSSNKTVFIFSSAGVLQSYSSGAGSDTLAN